MFGWEGTLREDTPVYTVNGWHEDALLRSGLEQVARIVQRRQPVFAREVRDSTGGGGATCLPGCCVQLPLRGTWRRSRR